MSAQFCYSTNGQVYAGSSDSRDAAIWECIFEHGIIAGATIYIGTVTPFEVNPCIADDVIQRATDDAEEACGESADSWLVGLPQIQIDDLNECLVDAFKAWLDRFGLNPTFWSVNDGAEYVVTDDDVRNAGSQQ